jgi:predicted Zn-dependent protease
MKFHCTIVLLWQLAMILLPSPPAQAFRKERQESSRDQAQTEYQVERVRQIMRPLLQATDHRIKAANVHLKVVDDAAINAASAGDGQFFVTTGLLRQASDEQLRGVLAHEIAHEDLGHPSKAQVLNAGVGIGALLLEKIFPGSSAIAPIAGTLVTSHYSRPMELAADRHAIVLLQRAGYSKNTMINTLSWLMARNGDTGGGIFASHPATSERIKALRAVH